MLQHLKVSNFALIDALSLELSPGLNVITGETGTGKSIIIKAMNILLGERTSTDFVREGKAQAEVQALFTQITPGLKEYLGGLELLEEGGEDVIVRRIVGKTGSKAFINGNLVNLSVLGNVVSRLLNICGQHENQKLIEEDEQLRLIDRVVNNPSLLKEVEEKFLFIKELDKQLEDLEIDDEYKAERIRYLSFQLEEINEVSPQAGEMEDLKSQEKKLAGIKDIAELCQGFEQALYSDQSAITILEQLRSQIKATIKFDATLKTYFDDLDEILSKLEELGSNMVKYQKSANLDEDEINEVIHRLEVLQKISRKYGGSIEQVLDKAQTLQTELDSLNNRDEEIKELKAKKAEAEKAYKASAKQLTTLRRAASDTLSQQITTSLNQLNMSAAKFKIEVAPLSSASRKGLDQVTFMISPNKGEGFKPISKIASGGELSRIMLAVTEIISPSSNNSLVFDEIDAGIGGDTGRVIGQKLKEISYHNQVLCITHLQQVAVFAETHLSIHKVEKDGRTYSDIKTLEGDEKVEEIARMLGGNLVKKQSLEHARAMLAEADKINKR